MHEQELKEKIVNVIARLNNICITGAICTQCKYSNYDNCTAHAIADSLVKELKLLENNCNVKEIEKQKEIYNTACMYLAKCPLDYEYAVKIAEDEVSEKYE